MSFPDDIAAIQSALERLRAQGARTLTQADEAKLAEFTRLEDENRNLRARLAEAAERMERINELVRKLTGATEASRG